MLGLDESPDESLEAAPHMVHHTEHASPLVQISWTQAGDGVLAAGAQGEIAMFRLPGPEEAVSVPSRQVAIPMSLESQTEPQHTNSSLIMKSQPCIKSKSYEALLACL